MPDLTSLGHLQKILGLLMYQEAEEKINEGLNPFSNGFTWKCFRSIRAQQVT